MITITNTEPVCCVCLSSCVTLVNITKERQLSAKEPRLVDMISECFNFKVYDNDIHPKNLCECCISDLRAAYRFKRNYEQNIKLKEKELDDFIESLATEDWELVSNVVKKELEDISDENIAQEIEPQDESNSENIDAEVAARMHYGGTVKKNKSHTCVYCGKVFIKKQHWTRHLRVHTGERPYNCPHCQRAFSQISSLKTHIRVHTGERIFKCPHCPKDFTRKYNLTLHVARHELRKDIQAITKLR
ncbi:zinc finger protein 300-like [Drosophila innubila]|uniref:zinc finger protein 300-like n=1 Tax=Drosophila innubila TaxID=198719 RepID=UPI00148E127D|nr:zinc finger protein 300-like [Drosophila innubila]